MNERQFRVGLDLFTGLVMASVGVALAGLTWHLAGYSAIPPVAVAVAGPAGNRIDIAGLLALAPFGNAEAASDAASDGSLHLKGIMLAVPASQSAALIAGADGKVASYGIGAQLGGGVVEAIEADQVIVRTSRGLQTIGFGHHPAGPPAVVNGLAGKGAGFVPVGAAAPPSAGGAVTPPVQGLRIESSAPPALLAAGLQPGDIVVNINGAPVTAGMSTDAVAHDLAGAALHGGSAQVTVLRNGNPVSLRLAIH